VAAATAQGYWITPVQWTDMADLFRENHGLADMIGVPAMAWTWPGRTETSVWPLPARGWRVRSVQNGEKTGLQAIFDPKKAVEDEPIEVEEPEGLADPSRPWLSERGL
jgi:hypothetical protein